MKIVKEGTESARVYAADTGTVWGATQLNEVMWMLALVKADTDNLEESRALLDAVWEDTGASKLVLFAPEVVDIKAYTRKLGFRQEGRLKNASLQGDLLVFGQYVT